MQNDPVYLGTAIMQIWLAHLLNVLLLFFKQYFRLNCDSLKFFKYSVFVVNFFEMVTKEFMAYFPIGGVEFSNEKIYDYFKNFQADTRMRKRADGAKGFDEMLKRGGSEYIPLVDGEVPRYRIVLPFSKVAWFTVSLPFFAFIFCVLWSIIYNFEHSTSTHCQVRNVFYLKLFGWFFKFF